MARGQGAASILKNLRWYIRSPKEIPLSSNLQDVLPLPDLTGVRVDWPEKYSWSQGNWYLDMVRNALSQFVPVVISPISKNDIFWHEKGGFPLHQTQLKNIGTPHHPKDLYDIRGEVFCVRRGEKIVRCAYDYSDYPVISEDIADSVQHYFKCVVPESDNAISSKVVSVGYFPSRPQIIAKARLYVLQHPVKKTIDVYGRFGTWTDGQGLREQLVSKLQSSSLKFTGGFGTIMFPDYLSELMKTHLALDAPGQAPITCRLPEAMAMGAVVVSRKPRCVFPEPMEDGVHYARIKDDASDVVDVCKRMLGNSEHLAFMSENAAIYFDRNFSPQSIARRILRHALVD